MQKTIGVERYIVVQRCTTRVYPLVYFWHQDLEGPVRLHARSTGRALEHDYVLIRGGFEHVIRVVLRAVEQIFRGTLVIRGDFKWP